MMLAEALPPTLASSFVFGALALMSDRPRGAFLAQIALALAAVLIFVTIVVDGPVLGLSPDAIQVFAVGVIGASVAGMLYHLYLGRFESVWAARAVFFGVYLVSLGLFGLVFLSFL